MIWDIIVKKSMWPSFYIYPCKTLKGYTVLKRVYTRYFFVSIILFFIILFYMFLCVNILCFRCMFVFVIFYFIRMRFKTEAGIRWKPWSAHYITRMMLIKTLIGFLLPALILVAWGYRNVKSTLKRFILIFCGYLL